MMNTKCIAYVQGPSLCKNGFPQSEICIGSTCSCCGRYSDKIPACQNEDIDKMWVDDKGYPKFAVKLVEKNDEDYNKAV